MIKNYISTTFANCLVLFAIYYLYLAPPAYGYFDLGTGAYMLQMIVGFGAAVWLSMRTSFIKFDRKRKGATAPSAAASADMPTNNAADAADAATDPKIDA